MKILFITLIAFFSKTLLFSQSSFFANPEYQVAYFGEFIAHPGVKAGVNFTFREKEKVKDKHKKSKGDYTISKLKKLKLGGNLAFYHQVNNHNGLLTNVELTYHRIKNKSFKPDKFGHFEMALGLGYFHYDLLGTTFKEDGDSFKEINGNGNAFAPSFSLAWGKNIRLVKSADVRYFIKPSVFVEVPYGRGVLPHLNLEIGVATSFNKSDNATK